MSVILNQVDAIDLLEGLNDRSVDCCITDPAYESLEKHRKRGTTTRLKKSKASSNKWFDIFPNERFVPFFEQLYRVMIPQTHSFIFCDDETDEIIRPIARRAGFWVWKSMIWVKTTQTVAPAEGILEDLQKTDVPSELMNKLTRAGNGYHGAASCEHILFLEKRSVKQPWPRQRKERGKGRKGNNLAMKDVLYAPRVKKSWYHGDDNVYPTEKPPSLIQQLVENSTNEGELILDPFAGSGVAGEIALQTGRRAILSDISTDSIQLIERRLNGQQP